VGAVPQARRVPKLAALYVTVTEANVLWMLAVKCFQFGVVVDCFYGLRTARVVFELQKMESTRRHTPRNTGSYGEVKLPSSGS
jgi:hypothetical protein